MYEKLVVCLILISVYSVLTVPLQDNNYYGAAQDIHPTLLSLEDRLKNLESLLISTDNTAETLLGKLENIDSKIEQLETSFQKEATRISTEINNKRVKDESVKDHTLRKINNFQDRLNLKMSSLSHAIEIMEKNMQGKIDAVISRQKSIEEMIETRENQVELELDEVLTSVVDTRTSIGYLEEQIQHVLRNSNAASDPNISNISAVIENKTKQLEENLNYQIYVVKEKIDKTDRNVGDAKQEIKEELNEYANKIAGMTEDLWETEKNIELHLNTLLDVFNMSKAEEAEVGETSIRTKFARQSPVEDSKIENFIVKMEKNFDTVKDLQRDFLDSCQRVQMDQSQLETTISHALGKLIDMFESQSKTLPKSFKSVEQLIKNHDGTYRRADAYTKELIEIMIQTSENSTKTFESEIKKVQDIFDGVKIALEKFNNIDFKSISNTLNEDHNEIKSQLNSIQQQKTNNSILKLITKMEDLQNFLLSQVPQITTINSSSSENMLSKNNMPSTNNVPSINNTPSINNMSSINTNTEKTPSININTVGITLDTEDVNDIINGIFSDSSEPTKHYIDQTNQQSSSTAIIVTTESEQDLIDSLFGNQETQTTSTMSSIDDFIANFYSNSGDAPNKKIQQSSNTPPTAVTESLDDFIDNLYGNENTQTASTPSTITDSLNFANRHKLDYPIDIRDFHVSSPDQS